jgi:mono/diheme cytochrome c family protein
MRHFWANIATYTIATMLIAGAALFAWLRSAQLVISSERAVLAALEPAEARIFDWRGLGGRSYAANCRNCHLAGGEGWDQYPGIGHTAQLFAAPGGREYLVDVHLYGLASDRWRAPMPPMGHMQDIELAAVINHVLTNFGNQERLPPGAILYEPADIAARRDLGLSPWQVNDRRP